MEITNVRIVLRNEKMLKAYASFVIDNCFIVTGLKVIDGPNGYFVSMPSKRKNDGAYQDIFYPINNAARKMIEDKVLDAFESEINKEDDMVSEP